jgi:hypothetical protein
MTTGAETDNALFKFKLIKVEYFYTHLNFKGDEKFNLKLISNGV